MCWRLHGLKIQKSLASSDDTLLRWPGGENVRLWSCRLGFDSESGQTNDFTIDIHSFPASHSALKGQCGEQTGKFTRGA